MHGSNTLKALTQARQMLAESRAGDALATLAPLLGEPDIDPDVWYLAGMAHCQRGEWHLGIERLLATSRAQPRNPEIHFHLGNALHAAEDFERAVRSYDKALKLAPGAYQIQAALGLSLAALQRYPRAIAALESALKSAPDDEAILVNLANVMIETGQFDAADRHLQHALSEHPASREALETMLALLILSGRHEDAEALLQPVLRSDPEDCGLRATLALLRERGGDLFGARDLLYDLIDDCPPDVKTYTRLILVLSELGDHSAALRVAERLRDEFPTMPDAIFAFAKQLRIAGNLEVARIEYQRVLSLDPHHAAAYSALAKLDTPSHALLKGLQREIKRALPASEARMVLEYTAGGVADRLKEYDRAFLHFQQANRIKGGSYDAKAHQHRISELIATLRAVHADADEEGLAPIFILGMPRSGTSLIEQILAAHSQVEACGEVSFFPEWHRHQVHDASYPKAMLDAGPERLAEWRSDYFRWAGVTGQKPMFTDKLPQNFLHLDAITRLFPNARVIHCRRDPASTALSIFQQNFAGAHAYAQNLNDLGHYYACYERLMAVWSDSPRLPTLEIDYEAMIEDQETESRRLVEFCGLQWEDGCLQFHQVERAVETASSLQVRQPIYRSALARGEHYAHWLKPFETSRLKTHAECAGDESA